MSNFCGLDFGTSNSSINSPGRLKLIFFTVVFLEMLTGAEIDIFVPSFPELQDVFMLTPFLVELTISVNLIAHCIASLVIGNLGDRYGRRPVIVYSLLVFVVGSVFCIFAYDYWVLLLGRILQGIGAAGPAVLSIVVIVDLYPTHEVQKKMGIINGAVTLAMAGAPILGSYVTRLFHWEGNFVLLLLMGVASLVLAWLYLPQGTPQSTISLSLREYLPVLRSKKTLYYIIGLGFLLQVYWVFIGLSPILYIDDLGVPLVKFGLYQGATAGAFALCSLLSGPILKRFGERNSFFAGVFFLLAFLVGALCLMAFNVKDPLLITIVLVLAAVGLVFPFNIMWSLALESVANAKARISALAIAIRLVITSLGLQVASFFYDHSFFSIGATMCVSLLLASICGYRLFRLDKSILKPHKHEELEWHL
jgi:DHA1 family bicyclomycin/chloramphenicol resistance-like MFS transporter